MTDNAAWCFILSVTVLIFYCAWLTHRMNKLEDFAAHLAIIVMVHAKMLEDEGDDNQGDTGE